MPYPDFSLDLVREATERLRPIVTRTPLERCDRLSRRYRAEIYLKREDLQVVRSYKLRGAYNRIAVLTAEERAHGVVCASAGNHAQGVAFACAHLGIAGTIFMPDNTPRQKVARVRSFGGATVSVRTAGDTFDAAKDAALREAAVTGATFIDPFDDPLVIAGQATVGVEIAEQWEEPADWVVGPIGGGGLMAGVGAYLRQIWPAVRLVGVEPVGAASMATAFTHGGPVTLPALDTFVDGAAVRRVGALPYSLCRSVLHRLLAVEAGALCSTMIELYQNEGIVTEPAGALPITALDALAEEIAGQRVVCIISGGNNDLARYPEILERSLVHQGLKHYFLIDFAQRPGALRRYLDEALGPD
ncbi:MAG: threonine dehydratase, biosynthetic, partial [Armatimonadetes bacterium]|nr:threonine dehydratase, biosynthetic [Armatimonadota bacterium]